MPRAARQVLLACSGVLLVVACSPGAPNTRTAGCLYDTQCKGRRICVSGVCSVPPTAVDAAPTQPSANKPERLDGPPPFAMFGGNAKHSGISGGVAPTTQPEELWKINIGAPIVGSPVIGPTGLIFVGSHDGNVYALGDDGTTRWSFATEDRVWTTPAVAEDGTVYVGSDDDHLYAIDSKDGSLRWKFRVGNCKSKAFGPEGTRCDVDSPPTIAADGTIYVGGDGVYAVWPNGTLRWKFATPEHVRSSVAITDNGSLIATCLDNAVYAIRPDGTKKWEYRTTGDIESSPSITGDGTVIVGGDDNAIHALSSDGTLKWKVVTGNDVRGTAASSQDGMVFVGSYDGHLYAIADNGEVKWRFTAADKVHSTPTLTKNRVLLFGSQDDQLYAVNDQGQLLWFVTFDGDVDATPAVTAGGLIIAASDDGTVRAFRRKTQ